MTNLERWTKQLGDQRGKKVVFLAHCLLNENTRYLGGACETGAVPRVIQECLDRGFGIVQMPCPEQHAWGGVLKRRLIRYFGAKGTLIYETRNIMLPLLLWYTRKVYHRHAKQVAKEVQDYLSSGFVVVGIVGVDGSPSCGARQTMNIRRSFELIGQLTPKATQEDMNAIVLACLMQGKGIFIEALHEELDSRHLSVPFLSFDLPSELRGSPSAPVFHRA
jgi:predicted secreted protein